MNILGKVEFPNRGKVISPTKKRTLETLVFPFRTALGRSTNNDGNSSKTREGGPSLHENCHIPILETDLGKEKFLSITFTP